MLSTISFPGIDSILSGTYTRAHGISPGIAELECAPQSNSLRLTGPLTFQCDGDSFTFQNCQVIQGTSFRTVGGATRWMIQVADRRWKWQFGAIYGEYNRRDQANNLIPDEDKPVIGKKKSAQELAKLLLEAMGESSFNVSVMPNDVYPHVAWIGVNPAQELANLCDLMGCRVALKVDDLVSIVRPGIGAFLPDGPVTQNSLVIDPPEPPDSIEVVGQPVRVQTRLELEAVGEESDGSIKPIDELSYKPSNGWSSAPSFDDITNKQDRNRAKRSIFRLYRVRDYIAVNCPSLPKAAIASDIQQILPISEELAETYTDPITKRQEHKRGKIYGIYNTKIIGSPKTNSSETINYEFKGSWSLDGERGLIRFDDLMYKFSTATGTYAAAELKLECSFNIRSNQTGQLITWGYNVKSNRPKNGTGPEVVYSDDLEYGVYEVFGVDGALGGWADIRSKASLEQESQYLAAHAFAKYQQQTPQDASYIGFLPIELDGAICSVTWSLNPEATTHASRITETELRWPKYGTRRLFELMNGKLKKKPPGNAAKKNLTGRSERWMSNGQGVGF